MAIIDKQVSIDPETGRQISNWDLVSQDEDTFIGFTLPFILDNGQEASTKTTLEAVKVNLVNLCNTEMGERVMQPNLGIRLKRFLFEPFSEEMVFQVQEVILDSLNYWAPFVNVNDIRVKMSDNESGDFRSVMEVYIEFNLKKDPETHESIQMTISN
jgi:phage baseplate assembly protein W